MVSLSIRVRLSNTKRSVKNVAAKERMVCNVVQSHGIVTIETAGEDLGEPIAKSLWRVLNAKASELVCMIRRLFTSDLGWCN